MHQLCQFHPNHVRWIIFLKILDKIGVDIDRLDHGELHIHSLKTVQDLIFLEHNWVIQKQIETFDGLSLGKRRRIYASSVEAAFTE